jgi:hypothetical protein
MTRNQYVFRSGPAAVGVISEVPGLLDIVRAMTEPVFSLEQDDSASATYDCNVRVLIGKVPDLSASRRNPELLLGPTRIEILHYSEHELVCVIDAGEGRRHLVQSRPSERDIELTLVDSLASRRQAALFLKFALGGLIHRSGARFVHAACVEREGIGYILAAPRAGGKSSLTFNAVTRAGFGFVSDDMIYLSKDGSSIRIGGWPRRLAVSSNVVAGHPLESRFQRYPFRRHKDTRPTTNSALPDWGVETRERFQLDLDEFQSATDARVVPSASLAAIVLPAPDQWRDGWSVTPCEVSMSSLVERHEVPTHDLKFDIDFLGMLPRDAVASPVERVNLDVAIPAVRLSYGPAVDQRTPEMWGDVINTIRGLADRSNFATGRDA